MIQILNPLPPKLVGTKIILEEVSVSECQGLRSFAERTAEP